MESLTVGHQAGIPEQTFSKNIMRVSGSLIISSVVQAENYVPLISEQRPFKRLKSLQMRR
jgi:hypothetical protein